MVWGKTPAYPDPYMAAAYGGYDAFESNAMRKQAADSSLIAWEHDFNEILDEFESDLLGRIPMKVRDNKTGENKIVWKQVNRPIINEQGAREIMMELRARVNRANVMGNYTQDQINAKLMNIAEDISDKLFLKRSEWEVDYANMSSIVDMCIDLVEAIFSRAYNATEHKLLGNIAEIKEIHGAQPSKKGWLRRMLPF